MASYAASPRANSVPVSTAASASIPWYIWLSAIGVASAMIGVHWDISWHRSIGRDTFWTPAHLAIQLCGVIAGITCGYLILATTFSNSPLRAASVNVLGFRGPLGAFICAWGGFAMITSAPFDDWWHNAYGLDVKILSPPHMVLAAGMAGVMIGALVLIGAQMNRSTGDLRRHLSTLFLFIAGMIIVMQMTVVLELTGRAQLHTAASYRVVGMLAPLVLGLAARGSGARWASTIAAAFYTGFLMLMTWILPLFPAEPKLGPVLHEVHQFIPNGFPLLIVIPALALDLLWPRMSAWQNWRRALVAGVVFMAIYWAVEWPFASFLQSDGARNVVFGSQYAGYFEGPQSFGVTNRFIPTEPGSAFTTGMAWAFVISVLSMWLGLGAGDWLKRVRR
jgi:hypothetical protein